MKILQAGLNRVHSLSLYLFYISSSFFFISCSVFTERKPDTEGVMDDAHFIVEEVTGRVVPTRVNGLPEEIQMIYKACFRDSAHPDNTLQNNLFKIHFFEVPSMRKDSEGVNTDNKKEDAVESDKKCSESSSFLFSTFEKSCIQIRTDSSGCLNWTEIYPYRSFNQSVWFRYERAFEGSGGNAGIKTIPMAMNPWLSVDPPGSASQLQLVDLRYHSIDKKGKLISSEKKNIAECRSCSVNKNESDCQLCQNKQRSLSYAISDFEQKTERPRLWVDELSSNISQTYISLDSNKEEHLKIFQKFKVCHSNLKENCDPPGRFLKVRLQMPLYIQVKNYRDEDEYLPLTRGNYSIKAYLFLQNERTGKNITLHRDMDFISSALTGGSKENSLISEFYLHIPYEHYSLPAFFGLIVQPEGDLKSFFLPFSAVFPFDGRLKNVIGRQPLFLDKEVVPFYSTNPFNSNFLESRYKLSGSWLHIQEESFEAESWRKAGWDVKLNRFRFSSVNIEKNKCPTAVDRTVRYVGEVCIVDPLTDEVVPSTSITIQRQDIAFSGDKKPREGSIVKISRIHRSDDEDLMLKRILGDKYSDGHREYLDGQSSEPYRSDTSGCLQWVDDLYHKWYNREKYFVRKMIFSKKEWGFEGERKIAINPWHWGFLFFQDITQLGDKVIRTTAESPEPEKPQVLLHDFRSQYIDLIYSIDRWLGINIFQNLSFLFKVRMDRPDGISVGQGGERPSSQDVRRGYYFLRFILVKSHTEESGGSDNQAVGQRAMLAQNRQEWNNYTTGFIVGRDGKRTGQPMNTNLEYITHFDTYVEVRDGLINSYINFLFELDEFIFIGSNNRLIVEFWPTDPQHYVYYEGTCKINPELSMFVPFKDHELITFPFMGPFVPGDQRNWNIFRVLSKYTNIDFPNTIDKGEIAVLDMDVDRFISKNKDTEQEREPSEHELFTKLGADIVFAANKNKWGDNARAVVNTLGPILRNFYREINLFLSTDTNDSLLAKFDEKRNQLIESTYKVDTLISTAIAGAKEGKQKSFFKAVQSLLHDALSTLRDNSISQSFLKSKMEEIAVSLFNIVKKTLPMFLSDSEEKKLLKKIQKRNQSKEVCGKWFNPGISCPEDPAEWTEFNMNLFGWNEGLKVITMDDALTSKFVDDLNKTAKIHNKYHFRYRQNKEKEKEKALNETIYEQNSPDRNKLFNQMVQNIGESKYETLSLEAHKELADSYENDMDLFWNNFALITGDDYISIDKKTKQMYLPNMTKNWLDTVVNNGIHSGTLGTPEVMTFLHSLCGFWFNHFYKEYLEQEQLDTIYLKHMEHYRYFTGILDHIAHTQNAEERHNDLVKSMEQYKLLPMNKDFLDVQKGSPFLIYDVEESSSMWGAIWDTIWPSTEREVDRNSDTVVNSIYKNKTAVLKLAQQTHAMSGGHSADLLSTILSSHRHPYFKCVANPLNFFHIEEKIIVGDIDDEHIRYEYGMPKAFNIQAAFDYSYSSSWAMSRSFSTSLGTGLGFLGLGGGTKAMKKSILSPVNAVNPFLSFSGISLSSDWSTRSSEDDSNRVQKSLRLADEGLYLNINHSVASIRLKQYRKCLVVRAQNMAFDGYDENTIWRKDLEENFIHQIPYIKSGLMICSEDKTEALDIPEDYFYMYQTVQGGLGQFQNIHSFRNRPFVMSIRGIHEMEKLMFLVYAFVEADKKKGIEDSNPYTGMTNPYDTQSAPAQGTREAIQNAKLWNKTGFYPGVYTVKYDKEHYLFHNTNSHYFRSDEETLSVFGRLTKWMRKHNPMGTIPTDGVTTPMRERHGGNY